LAELIGGCVFTLLFSQPTWYFDSMGCLAGLGLLQYIIRIGNNTLLQTIVPDALRGRVMSIYMLDNGLTPLATMSISFLIHIWSPAGAYTTLASVSLVLALLQLAFFRRIRQPGVTVLSAPLYIDKLPIKRGSVFTLYTYEFDQNRCLVATALDGTRC